MRPFVTRLWEGWKRGAHWIGDKQTTLIYAMLYTFVVGPIALVRKPFVDPFRYRRRKSDSFWIPRPQPAATLEDASRQ